MYYFSTFPVAAYSINNAAVRVPIDITKRFTINQLTKSSAITYYTYNVQDGDRPDTVALKFYKDSRLDWLVLHVNETQDPQYSWPLDYMTLNRYITQKYGSVSSAMAGTHHYEQIISQKSKFNNPDGEVVNVPEITVVVDSTTYSTLSPSERTLVSNYDYELDLNDQHRVINLIDPTFLSIILRAYKDVFA